MTNNINNAFKIHIILKSSKKLFIHYILFIWPIALKFCTNHDSMTAVLGADSHKNSSTKTEKYDFCDTVKSLI